MVDLLRGALWGQRFVLSDTQLGGAVPDGPRRRLAIYQVEAGRVAEAVSGLATVIWDGSLDRSELMDRASSPPEVVYEVG